MLHNYCRKQMKTHNNDLIYLKMRCLPLRLSRHVARATPAELCEGAGITYSVKQSLR